MAIADLHNHTTFSDGLLTPTEMINRALKNDVEFFAITDHDTVSGLPEAINVSKSLPLTFIPGIELSTEYNEESIHILGYFTDDNYNNPELISFLEELENRRFNRAKIMIEKLKNNCNIDIDFDNVRKRSKNIIARPHIAAEIIAQGYNYTTDYIFDNFIGKGCPAYEPVCRIPTEEGITLLKKYNCIVSLAHPVLIKYSPVSDFMNLGFDAMEAIYYQNTPDDEKRLVALARENNLLITGGSDCHGNSITDTKHGDIGKIPYPIEYFNEFYEFYKSKLL